MRHLRPFAALVTVAALTVACGSSPGSGGESQGAEQETDRGAHGFTLDAADIGMLMEEDRAADPRSDF